jgi:putative redox protein
LVEAAGFAGHGRLTMEAQIRLDTAMQFRGGADAGPEVVMDADPQFGGRNAGPQPMDLVLLALIGCTAMDVISILRKKREPVEAYQVKATATRAQDHPRIFTEIHIEHIVTGDVREESLARAIELSDTKYCSVRHNLRPETRIVTSHRIVRTT